MKIQIVMYGEPHLSFAKEGIDEYLKRSSRFGSVDLISIKEGKDSEKKLFSALENSEVILLDEKGKKYDTHSLTKMIDSQIQQSTKTLSFVVGGPDGHSKAVKEKYQRTFSLSDMTLPHDLAVLFLAESIYRSLTILAGHPYHRD